MWWKYHLVEKSRRIYIYAYSRESTSLDGRITFDVEKQAASLLQPSVSDKASKKAQDKALQHFQNVIDNGFPEEYDVCCG